MRERERERKKERERKSETRVLRKFLKKNQLPNVSRGPSRPKFKGQIF